MPFYWQCQLLSVARPPRPPPEKDAFIRYQNDPDDPHSLIGGNVDLIYEGRHGMLWIALEAV